MSREIKFRAWNKETKKMVDLGLPHDLGDISNDCIYGGNWEEFLIPMQYTGLKDKNGKEIYEGDILSYPQEECIISIRWDMSYCGFAFDEHGIYDDGVGRGNWVFTLGISKNCEIIGNIYENPELLSTSQPQGPTN